MQSKIEPVVIHKIGVSGRVKEAYVGVIVRGKTHIIENADTLDDVLHMIKNGSLNHL
jgi:predicted phage-related endonuclease